jgi:hypothetical protein
MMNLYEQRDFGQIINATVEFIRLNLKPLARCLLLVALPVTLVLTLVSRSLVVSGFKAALLNTTAMLSVSHWAGLALSSVSGLVLAGTVYAYMLEYEAGNADIRPAHIWPRLARTVPVMLLAGIVAAFLIGLTVFVLFLPLIWLAVCFVLLPMVVMREQANPVQAPLRSVALLGSPWWSSVTGSPFFFWLLFIPSVREKVANFWTTIGLVGICSFVILVLQGVVSAPALLMGISDGFFNTRLSLSRQSEPLVTALSLLATAVGTFVGAILPVALGFQYYNLLDQREGGGLLSLVETIGQQPVSAEKNTPHIAQLRTEDEGDF